MNQKVSNEMQVLILGYQVMSYVSSWILVENLVIMYKISSTYVEVRQVMGFHNFSSIVLDRQFWDQCFV